MNCIFSSLLTYYIILVLTLASLNLDVILLDSFILYCSISLSMISSSTRFRVDVKLFLVRAPELESGTSSLSAMRSNQLSYARIFSGA